MIEAFVTIGDKGEWQELYQFPVLPSVGQLLLVWRGRDLAAAEVGQVYFVQKEGYFQPTIQAQFVSDMPG